MSQVSLPTSPTSSPLPPPPPLPVTPRPSSLAPSRGCGLRPAEAAAAAGPRGVRGGGAAGPGGAHTHRGGGGGCLVLTDGDVLLWGREGYLRARTGAQPGEWRRVLQAGERRPAMEGGS